MSEYLKRLNKLNTAMEIVQKRIKPQLKKKFKKAIIQYFIGSICIALMIYFGYGWASNTELFFLFMISFLGINIMLSGHTIPVSMWFKKITVNKRIIKNDKVYKDYTLSEEEKIYLANNLEEYKPFFIGCIDAREKIKYSDLVYLENWLIKEEEKKVFMNPIDPIVPMKKSVLKLL